MQAFNNDKKLKAGLLKEVHKHFLADQITKGTYGEGNGNRWRGCSVGCSICSYNFLTGQKNDTSAHGTFEKFGFPKWLAKVQDTIFEGLPEKQAVKWPERFFKAVKPGADLNKIKAPFLIYVLQFARRNVDKKKFPEFVKAINDVIGLHKENCTDEEKWSAAASAAWPAAWSAGSAARAAESAAAAASAAQSAESAQLVARSVWAAAASAQEDAYSKFANKLIELMKAA